ncbi:hypothetical protein Tco_1096544 [Tanacetum coccineum]
MGSGQFIITEVSEISVIKTRKWNVLRYELWKLYLRSMMEEEDMEAVRLGTKRKENMDGVLSQAQEMLNRLILDSGIFIGSTICARKRDRRELKASFEKENMLFVDGKRALKSWKAAFENLFAELKILCTFLLFFFQFFT